MSAKKKDRNDWLECLKCQAYYLRNIVSGHKESCDGVIPVNSPDYCYIYEGTFAAQVSCFEGKPVKVTVEKPDIILIHPSTIKACNFQVATLMAVQFNGKICYGTVWPLSSMPLNEVYLSLSKFKSINATDGDRVQVVDADVFPVLAKTITLEPLTNDAADQFHLVSDCLLSSLDDTYLASDEFVSVNHYNNQLFYLVRCINESEDDLSNRLSKLDVNKSGEVEKELVYHVMFTQTVLSLQKQTASEVTTNSENNLSGAIGGLFSQKKLFEEIISYPFSCSTLYTQFKVHIPHGILIHGSSGTGKTCFINHFLSSHPNITSKIISGPELISKYQGETEANLRELFMDIMSKSPSVLVIDEFDVLCPMITTSSNDSEKRLVATFASLMDSIKPLTQFIVIGITNKLDKLDISLRRSGRFDKEIEFGIPNSHERLDIFEQLFVFPHSLTKENFVELSEITHGYVGADIYGVQKESGLIAMKRYTENQEVDKTFSVDLNDVKHALTKIGPSAMKEVAVDVPKVFWKDVGGQAHVKQKLKEAIEWPLIHPEVFLRLGITPPRGLLLYGPPGCSKTLMAKALATESSLNFISIKGPELFNKYLGESERAVRNVFQKARTASPSIIFFDEIDAIGVQRSQQNSGNNAGDKVLAQILTEMDGVESLDDVIVIAATNRPDIIDPALLRPGRIDRLIYVPLPDKDSRKEIFEIQFRTIPVACNVMIEKLVDLSDGYSGAEICSLCRESALQALRKDFNCSEVKMEHFEAIFNQIKPATDQKTIRFYEDFLSRTTTTF